MSRSNNARRGSQKHGAAGPAWWHHVHSTKPARRVAHVIESTLRNRAPFRPFVCGEPDCEGCEFEAFEAADGFHEADRVFWPLPRKPHHYYW